MKVKELVKKLKQMPQNLEIGVGEHDNAEYEVSGWPCAVYHIIKDEHDPGTLKEDIRMFNGMPKEWVVIHC